MLLASKKSHKKKDLLGEDCLRGHFGMGGSYDPSEPRGHNSTAVTHPVANQKQFPPFGQQGRGKGPCLRQEEEGVSTFVSTACKPGLQA